MNPLPLGYDPRAVDDLRALPLALRPAVLEFLSRISCDYTTCSRRSPATRPPGLEAGLWCRSSDGGACLVEVLFRVVVEPDRIVVRRVIITEVSRLPGWVANPAEWPSPVPPWPIVDV